MAGDNISGAVEMPKYERHLRVRPRRSKEAIAGATGKFCPRCGETKPNTEFGVARDRADGLFWCCRTCSSRRARTGYYADIEKSREVARLQQKRHRENNPESSAAAILKYRTSDGGERNRRNAKKCYYKDPQKHNARRREWEKQNPEKHAAEKLRWQKRREERDPAWRMVRAIRRRIAGILAGQKSGRRTFDMLGYEPQELREHVAALFTGGMSWENYGEWHLDHDRPVASFDFDQEGAMRECWALSNLKPMWKPENRAKSSTWNGIKWARKNRPAASAP